MKQNRYKPRVPDIAEAIFDTGYLLFDLIAGILFFIAPDGMQKRFTALRFSAILPKKAQEIVFPPREQNCILVKKHSAALFFRIKAQPLHRGRLLFDRFTPKHIRFNLGGKSAAHRKQKTFH